MCMLFIVFIISFCLVFFGPCEKEEFNQRDFAGGLLEGGVGGGKGLEVAGGWRCG